MTRQFVELSFFRKIWAALGLDDDALDVLERQLLANPNAGRSCPVVAALAKFVLLCPDKANPEAVGLSTLISSYKNGYISCFHIRKVSKKT